MTSPAPHSVSVPDQPRVIRADLADPTHQAAIVTLVDAYSRDGMGDGQPLAPAARERLIPGLQELPTSLVFLAFVGAEAVGIAVCFRGFSTFAGRPLINVHDLAVLPAWRGHGVGRALLAAVETHARGTGCCKLTLEVLDRNERALRTYLAAGFARYSLQPGAGEAIFLTKPLYGDGA